MGAGGNGLLRRGTVFRFKELRRFLTLTRRSRFPKRT